MSLIVAGRFDTFARAEEASRALFLDGFSESDVTIFFVNPAGQHDRTPIGGDRHTDAGVRHSPKGASLAGGLLGAIGAGVGVWLAFSHHVSIIIAVLVAAVGAYVGTLIGAMVVARGASQKGPVPQADEARHAGVLLAVHVTRENENMAAATLREHGAMDVENATGSWRDGVWEDFDPIKPPAAPVQKSVRDSIYN